MNFKSAHECIQNAYKNEKEILGELRLKIDDFNIQLEKRLARADAEMMIAFNEHENKTNKELVRLKAENIEC